MAKSKQITKTFGKNRRWLNPRSNDCKAGVVWTVEVCVFPNEDMGKKDKAYLEAYFTSTEETQNHWVYKRGDLAPIRILQEELTKFKSACAEALAHIEEQGYDYDSY